MLLRCVVKCAEKGRCCCCTNDGAGSILLESYAVIAGDTKLSDLCSTALDAVGLPDFIPYAKGKIMVKNWNVLTFDQITENVDETVDFLLTDLSSNVSLLIVVSDTEGTQTPITVEVPDQDDANDKLIQQLMVQHLAAVSVATAVQNQMMVTKLFKSKRLNQVPNSDIIMERSQHLMLNCQKQNVEPTSQVLVATSPSKRGPFANGLDNALAFIEATSNPVVTMVNNGQVNVKPEQTTPRSDDKITDEGICVTPSPETDSITTFLGGLDNMLPEDILAAMDLSNYENRSQDDGEADADDQIELDHIQQTQLNELFASNIFSGNVAAAYLESIGTSFSPDSMCNSMTNSSREPGPSDFKKGKLWSAGAKRQRSRLMFDSVTEVPQLEKWFAETPHPSCLQVDQYAKWLNEKAYRAIYPPVAVYNIKIWFKNHRAKKKRRLTIESSL